MNDKQKAIEILDSLTNDINNAVNKAIDMGEEYKLCSSTICTLIVTALGSMLSCHILQNGVRKKEIFIDFCESLQKSIGVEL